MILEDLMMGPIAGVFVGVVGSYIFVHILGKKAGQTATEIRKAAQLEAENICQQAKLAAKDELIRMRDEFEKSTAERRRELQGLEKEFKDRELNIDRKMDLIQKRLDDVSRRDEKLATWERELDKRDAELDKLRAREMDQLQAVASMTRDQARVTLMQKLEEELTHERGVVIRRHMEEMRGRCEREAQKILVQAMQRYAGECANERTTATIPLPSDEMKGRIIGREGRNIRVFEAITGVNVLIDDTPSAVVISCFDPVRREAARLALERLVADGRIHPTRVEEVVEKAHKDIESEIVAAGEEAVHTLHLTSVPPQVIKVLGRLKYRYSYSQNVLQHSVEVASFMAMIAADLGLDVDKGKMMGLLHDIGKALDHDIEGGHADIGMEFLRRAGVDKEVVNGVGCHHNDLAPETTLAALVCVCDALSASRPGARSETTEIYLKRLEQLEAIGNSFTGVDQCYAVQAGREVRVVVEPEKLSEDEAVALSKDLADRIQNEMQYPGQIKVCVIRETRSVEYAK